jgi:hypothetical protein
MKNPPYPSFMKGGNLNASMAFSPFVKGDSGGFKNEELK